MSQLKESQKIYSINKILSDINHLSKEKEENVS